tara:strand:+ start:8069 stop:8317 length:249 start_codon:yes stop_codon:yes gene_type:complete
MYDKNGLKYFLYNTTINKKSYLELPEELRKYIWDLCHIYPFIQCYICDKVLINFQVNIGTMENVENYSIVNGITKCNTCFKD